MRKLLAVFIAAALIGSDIAAIYRVENNDLLSASGQLFYLAVSMLVTAIALFLFLARKR